MRKLPPFLLLAIGIALFFGGLAGVTLGHPRTGWVAAAGGIALAGVEIVIAGRRRQAIDVSIAAELAAEAKRSDAPGIDEDWLHTELGKEGGDGG